MLFHRHATSGGPPPARSPDCGRETGVGSPEGVRRISSGPQDPPTTATGKPLVSGPLPTRPTCPTLRSPGTAQNPAYRPARSHLSGTVLPCATTRTRPCSAPCLSLIHI